MTRSRARQPPSRGPVPRRHAAAWCAGLLMVVIGPWVVAAPARHELDPVHTRVVFAVGHAGFSQAIGTVTGSTGSIEFDPEDWRTARLQVRVPLDRLDLGDADWNRAVMARRLLDVERHPEASFTSTRIEPVDATHFLVHGDLVLRGVRRAVSLDVTVNAIKRHPMPPFRRTAGFSARGTLSRSDFGIDAWPAVIGDAVELRIEVEAVRAAAGAGDVDAMPGADAGAGDPGAGAAAAADAVAKTAEASEAAAGAGDAEAAAAAAAAADALMKSPGGPPPQSPETPPPPPPPPPNEDPP